MRQIKLTLEYDGTNYAGWQSQINATAIQDVVLSAVEKMTEEKTVLRGASRTDSGVHALAQVACFQTDRDISCDGFLKGLNSLLPEDIRVTSCEEVSPDFHPVRNAKSKLYQYILDLGEVASPLWRQRAWWVGPKLDIAAMEEGSKYLIDEHDFKSFQGALSHVRTTVRILSSVEITTRDLLPYGNCRFLCLVFTGNGFLKYMIRNIVGTLVEIGLGKRLPEEMKSILLARDRKDAGITAPPQGLYLVNVEY
ncbi:MAG: tRNA pseudouridine(38-40) synthase TruA [Deltaproteobacteria bacterium]|nr:tRNA pseudouridine(38-40) synthase TruA [Deltaproteobacteria bacterium]